MGVCCAFIPSAVEWAVVPQPPPPVWPAVVSALVQVVLMLIAGISLFVAYRTLSQNARFKQAENDLHYALQVGQVPPGYGTELEPEDATRASHWLDRLRGAGMDTRLIHWQQ